MKNKELNKMATKRTRRLEARVTSEEYTKAAELAETCGLSLSDYIRQCSLGQHPRQRKFRHEWLGTRQGRGRPGQGSPLRPYGQQYV